MSYLNWEVEKFKMLLKEIRTNRFISINEGMGDFNEHLPLSLWVYKEAYSFSGKVYLRAEDMI